jgi:hypothetical protein
MDLQGAELLSLNGAHRSLDFCKFLYIEVSNGQVYKNAAQWTDVKSFLEKKGFKAMSELDKNHSNILFIKNKFL